MSDKADGWSIFENDTFSVFWSSIFGVQALRGVTLESRDIVLQMTSFSSKYVFWVAHNREKTNALKRPSLAPGYPSCVCPRIETNPIGPSRIAHRSLPISVKTFPYLKLILRTTNNINCSGLSKKEWVKKSTYFGNGLRI